MKTDSQLTDIPVIIITARASDEDRILSLSLGVDDYLAKPFISEEMLLRVRNILNRLDLARVQTEKKSIEVTLAAAQKVHRALGSDTKEVPAVSTCDYYQPAEITGGDWFGTYFDSRLNRLYILIGDVTGHGVHSALVTVAAAGSVAGGLFSIIHREQEISMQDALFLLAQGVNEAVRHSGSSFRRYMTMAFICLDLQTGEGAYLNAGHLNLYIIRKEKINALFAQGSYLGMPHPSFQTQNFQLFKGESLFLYTDGLIENKGPDERFLKTRHLEKLLNYQHPLEDIKTHILEKGKLIWRDRTPEDDCTFLIVKWDPSEPENLPGLGEK